MKTFLVIAHDADDEEALARRNATRPAHFARIVPYVESQQIMMGGGMLADDDESVMIGSAFFATFESREAVQAWCDADPYAVNRVWSKFEIIPMKIVVRDGQIIR